MREKRRHPRFATEGVDCNMMSATTVDIIDMSVGGIALMANVRLDMNKEYTLKLEDRGNTFSVRGTVVWSVLGGTGTGQHGEIIPIYEAGLKFTNSIPKNSAIHDFIRSHKVFRDHRIIARFDIRSPERAVLHYPYRYGVKKISLGGMLVKTTRPFAVEDTFPLEIFLAREKTVKVFGRIASCQKISEEETERYYLVGVEFLEMSEDDRKILGEFLGLLQQS